MYAFVRSGVQPLRAGHRYLVERHAIDAIVPADGGTDILMRVPALNPGARPKARREAAAVV